ncbi:hypothetical protein AMTRI_Chr03g44020 [Amborella trichopoda]
MSINFLIESQTPLFRPWQKELVDPPVKGALNVLKASHEAGIKRVVLLSSMAAVVNNPKWPKDIHMDETCWSEMPSCKTAEAYEYANKTGVNLTSVCPTLVAGPMLQTTVNISSNFLNLSSRANATNYSKHQ